MADMAKSIHRLCFATFLKLYTTHCDGIGGQREQIKLFSDAFFVPYGQRGLVNDTTDTAKITKICNGVWPFSKVLSENKCCENEHDEFTRTLGYFRSEVFTKFPSERLRKQFVLELSHLILSDESIDNDTYIDSYFKIEKGDLEKQDYIYFESFVVTVFLLAVEIDYAFACAKADNKCFEELEKNKYLLPIAQKLHFDVRIQEIDTTDIHHCGQSDVGIVTFDSALEVAIYNLQNRSYREAINTLNSVTTTKLLPKDEDGAIKIPNNYYDIKSRAYHAIDGNVNKLFAVLCNSAVSRTAQ